MDSNPITAEWLAEVGFKWHQMNRQPDKHWVLWLGGAIGGFMSSYEDIGIEVAPTLDGQWFCWLRSDVSHKYSRFIHLRHIDMRGQLIAIVEAITGQPWMPQNHLYGSARRPEDAARIRKDFERLDRRLMHSNPWSDAEKDDTCGGALPDHLNAWPKAEPADDLGRLKP